MLNPWTDLDRAFARFDRLQRHLLAEAPTRVEATPDPGVRFNVHETDEAWLLVGRAPGVDPASLEVHVQDDLLTLKGARKVEIPEGYEPIHRERKAHDFERRFRFGGPLQADAVTARFEHGMLLVQLPKAQATPPRRIEVTVG